MEANVVVRRKTVASGNGKDKSSRRNSLQVSRRLSAISTVSNFTSSSLSRTDSEKNTDGGEFRDSRTDHGQPFGHVIISN